MRSLSVAATVLVLSSTAWAITPIGTKKEAAVNAIDRVIASEEIRNLKARYWLGVDRRDAAMIKSTLAPDVVADYTQVALPPGNSVSEVLRGADKVAAGVAATPAEPGGGLHFGGQPVIDVTSETTATVIWPMIGFGHLAAGGATRVGELYYYHDSFERIGGVWKIKSIRLTHADQR
jgi:hypothetical protein